jgi:hypothetical protein
MNTSVVRLKRRPSVPLDVMGIEPCKLDEIRTDSN